MNQAMKNIFLCIVALCAIISAKAQEITGQVKDSSTKEALIGANVSIKGSTSSVLTDANGTYKIKLGNVSNPVLVIRYMGYKTAEVNINNQKVINVDLASENILLQEVVAIGYATVDRKDLTGSISSVSARQLQDVPISSVEQALAGRLAGIQVTTSEGTPDAEVKIRVRGGNSITQDNSPIYIVDGVQLEEGLQGLAVQDIESIDVLKDASSSSIYGARGANGVVIVTTKQGSRDKTRINYNPFFGVSQVAKKLDVMNVYEYLTYQQERSRLGSIDSLGFVGTYGEDISVYKDRKAIDWQEEMFGRNAFSQTHNLSVSGGNKDTRFNLTYTRNDQDAIMLKSNYKRDLVSLRFDNNVSAKLKVGANFRYSNEIVNGAGVSDGGAVTYNLLRNIIKYQPIITSNSNIDEIDDDYDTGNTNYALINPIALNNARDLISRTNAINVNGNIEYKFTPSLSFKSVLGYNTNNRQRQSFDSEITPVARFMGGHRAMVGDLISERTGFNNSNTLNYNKRYGKDHRLTLLLGHEIYSISYKGITSKYRNFPLGISSEKALNQYNLGEMELAYPLTDVYESRIVSFFSRANYSYKNKYLLTASLRSDGSSKFDKSERWGYFPAVSAAWKVSLEPFMKDVRFLTDLKLRASLGKAGNNRIADYLFLSNYRTDARYFMGNELQSGYFIENLSNKRLKWETTMSRNLGLDFTILKGLNVTVDAYSNTTDDLLISMPIPITSGYNTQLQNVAKTRSRGIEFQIGGSPIRSQNFTWNTDFNIAFNRNKVLRISDYVTERQFPSGVFSGSDYILKQGSAVGLMYGYVADGFYKLDDFDYNPSTSVYTLKAGVTDAGVLLGTIQPGMMKLKDLDDDGVIGENDRTVIGNANPKFVGGFNQQFRYKQFDLSVFVNFVYGNDVYNASKVEFTNGYSRFTNMLTDMNGRWRTIDENGDRLQKITGSVVTGASPDKLAALNANATIWMPGTTTTSGFLPTTWAMEDGSFLRLNNITFGYTLPTNILRKVKVHSLRLYGTLNNIALWTNYSGFDPEVNTRRSSPLTPSVDYSAYPRSKSFIFGLNLTL